MARSSSFAEIKPIPSKSAYTGLFWPIFANKFAYVQFL